MKYCSNAAEDLRLLPAGWHLQLRNSYLETQNAIGSKNIKEGSLVKRCKRITRCQQCHLKPAVALLALDYKLHSSWEKLELKHLSAVSNLRSKPMRTRKLKRWTNWTMVSSARKRKLVSGYSCSPEPSTLTWVDQLLFWTQSFS